MKRIFCQIVTIILLCRFSGIVLAQNNTLITLEKYLSLLLALMHKPVELFEIVQEWMERTYEKIIRFTLKHKLLIIMSSLILFASSIGLVTGVPKTFMPPEEHGEFMVLLEAEPGTSLRQMEEYSREIESTIRKEKEIKQVLTNVGNSNGESNTASIFIELVPSAQRKRSTTDMKEYYRTKLISYKQLLNPTVNDIAMAGEDQPFAFMLVGENIEQLAVIGEGFMEQFKAIPGLVDLKTNYQRGKPEFQIQMNPLKMEKLGIQSLTAGLELRGMVEGITPAKYRENGLEYNIRVKLRDDQRDLSREFNSLYVPNVNNQLVKLKNIADPVRTTGPSKIYRRNRSRYVLISGNLDKNGAIGDITAKAKKIVEKEKFPEGVSYEFLGASEDFRDLFSNMMIAGFLSIIFIYIVLASLYESLIIPLTIMISLPLAIVGGLLALIITGQSINIFTMIGFIMLLGLVTKNSILLVDYAQRSMRMGLSRDEALIKAGLTRLRPILMTTFALIAGMTPLALALTEMGKFRQSMGIAIIGGLISSTALTLIVIPAIFGYMDTFRLWTRKLVGRPILREIDKVNE